MPRRYPLLIFLTFMIIVTAAYYGVSFFKLTSFPFYINYVDSRTAVITPIPGIPLPSALQSGDRIDLSALNRATRLNLLNDDLPLGKTIDLVVHRDGAEFEVPVTVVDYMHATNIGWAVWPPLCYTLLAGAIALLVLWRGRNRAALAMVFWLIAYLTSDALYEIPADGILGFSFSRLSDVFALLARIGFYMMVETVVGPSMSSRARTWFRGSFILLLALGAVLNAPGGELIYVMTGSAELLRSGYGLLLTASYLSPFVMLAVSYGTAENAQRLRLRWMLWSSLAWITGILLIDTGWLGLIATTCVAFLALSASLFGFGYAVLRHRMVDVSVVIDRTLVYGGVTALVIGLLAAINSLVEHAALGTGASLFLQALVPLALGIVLSRVRTYLDRFVEQVFFRRKYRAEKALRRFARHAAVYGRSDDLMQAAMKEIREQLGVPAVAVYEYREEGYTRVYQAGEQAYPEQVKADDAGFVAIRADKKDIELSEFVSGLGADGHLFPMNAFGAIQGVLVCANRPGERYTSDECRLLAHVAHHLGMALHIIDARQNREFVHAVARGEINTDSVQASAQRLELNWVTR